MRTPFNLFLSKTSIGLGASNSLMAGGKVDFGIFLSLWVHGVVSDGVWRTIRRHRCTCDIPLIVAMYVFSKDLDTKLEKGRNGKKWGQKEVN